MGREIHRLSSTGLKAKAPGYHADGGNLYFRVSGTGTRGWIFRFALNGRTRDAGLGPYPEVGLADARAKAFEFRQFVVAGIDPIEQRNGDLAAARVESAKTITFDDCRAAYIAAHEAAWKNAKHRQQWTNTLQTYATPVFGKLPVSAIDTGLVVRAIEPIWTTKPETAGRVRGRIEAVLDWAKVRGYRAGRTPRDGRATSTTSCRPSLRCGRSDTIPRCPTTKSEPSWRTCGRARASPLARWSLLFSVPSARVTSSAMIATTNRP